jgi:hypothetical protein
MTSSFLLSPDPSSNVARPLPLRSPLTGIKLLKVEGRSNNGVVFGAGLFGFFSSLERRATTTSGAMVVVILFCFVLFCFVLFCFVF